MSSPQSDDDDEMDDVEFVSVRHISPIVTLKVFFSESTELC